MSDLTTGATVGLSTLDGDPLLKYSADGKSAVLADGHSYSADKWDINPSQLKVGANGEAIISGVDPKDQAIIKPSGASFDMVGGKVVSYKLPGSDSVDVAKMQATNPKAEAKYNATDGSLSINDGDKQSFVVYKDGSLDQTVKGANGAPDLQVHRDSHLNLLPTDAQAKELGQLADAAIKDTAQQPKFAQELMKRIQTRQDLSTFFEALNNGVLKQMGASVALQTGDDKKLNIILTKDGKPIAIPFS